MALTNEQLRKIIARRKAINKNTSCISNKKVIQKENCLCSKKIDVSKIKAAKNIPKSSFELFFGPSFKLSDYKKPDKNFGFIYTNKAKEMISFETLHGTKKMSFMQFDSLDNDEQVAIINSCVRKKYGNDYISAHNYRSFVNDLTKRNINKEKELIDYIFAKLEVSHKFLSQANAVLDDLSIKGSVKSREQYEDRISGSSLNVDLAHSSLQKAIIASRFLMSKEKKQ